MERDVQVKSDTKFKKKQDSNRKDKKLEIPDRKCRGRKLNKKELPKKSGKDFVCLKKLFIKKNLVFVSVIFIDIVFIIYAARKNVVNYVSILGKDIFLGDTKNLLVGRNYISLIITVFFYLYLCLLNHFFLKKKNSKKFLVGMFLFFFFLNTMLFLLFTKRVY